MRIALAQINPKVGDIGGNSARILEFSRRAQVLGADIAVFPECALTGYPAWDLWEDDAFVHACSRALARLAAASDKTAILCGHVEFNRAGTGKRLLNCASLLRAGRRVAVRAKTLLPTYDVFDEARYFESASRNLPLRFRGKKLGITICEDVWNSALPRRYKQQDPVAAMKGADAVINLSASPFCEGKPALRRRLIASHARRTGAPFVYCNQAGGNDDLVFDGNSFAVNAAGRVIARAKPFEEDLVVFETSGKPLAEIPPLSDGEEIFLALAAGIRDYLAKCGFKKAVLGLSGGIDSAVVCALAAYALGPENVTGVAMPSRYSAPESARDARMLAQNLGVKYQEIGIEPLRAAFDAALAPLFCGLPSDITEENLQARIRGALLMALSNKTGAMLLSTGNKSEIAVGYCTLYGDMCGGLAPLADLAKTKVYALARHINARMGAPIPEHTITRPPSAELRPDQTDQDELPPYEVLDGIIKSYIEEGKTPRGGRLVRKMLDKMDFSEFKRKQAAIGLKLTQKAFGVGRRMPVARGSYR
ncbi:MAG: NAD+ synthase [Elusimicrobiales bacterium]